MFDVGFLELLLVGAIALIVLGPERLPKAAQTLGQWIGKAKQSFEAIKTEIDREVKLKELQQEITDQKANIKQQLDIGVDLSDIKNQVNEATDAIQSTGRSIGSHYQDEQLTDSSNKNAKIQSNKDTKSS